MSDLEFRDPDFRTSPWVNILLGALDNPTYFSHSPSLRPAAAFQGQDNDALAADYLEPVATLPVFSTKNGKIEAASSNCNAKGNDGVNDLEIGVLSNQKSYLMPKPESANGADEE